MDYFLQRDRAQAVGLKLPGNRNVGPKGLSENQPSSMLAPTEERMDGRREEEGESFVPVTATQPQLQHPDIP